MDDEELNELFGMEDQADDGAAGNGGMFVVEDHGGKIWATSKEDTGTIMYFVIRKYQEVINE